MKRLTALTLAIALVSIGVPALAHNANYPGECDSRIGGDVCETDEDHEPAHRKCTGPRFPESKNDPMIERSFSIAQKTVGAYIYSPDDAEAGGSDPLSPGLIWIETNNFNDLQRTGYECKSDAHENPDEWQTHADTVLI